MTPVELYQQKLAAGELKPDPYQARAIQHLQRLYEDIIDAQASSATLWSRFVKWLPQQTTVYRGIYLWGSVGVGKTSVLDIFYQALPITRKLRLHFHQFMQRVHLELKEFEGHKDPLKKVAKYFAAQADVICFDEFLVNDIADAMILANLLAALFTEGITLVTTANVEPDVLYRSGLQRSRFLPAITLLKKYLDVIHLPGTTDYRLQTHELFGAYYYPLTEQVAQRMREQFMQLTQECNQSSELLVINGRPISTVAVAGKIAWFDFQALCSIPRSQLDYLDIAQRFHTIFLSNIPKIAVDQDNTARYLINLVDILYDSLVKLVISAEVPVTEIYREGRLFFEFHRTSSRLLEMQSEEYLRKADKK